MEETEPIIEEKVDEPIKERNQKPFDLKLQEAMVKNMELIDNMNQLTKLTYWIKFFMIFSMVVLMLVALRFFRVF